MRHPNRLPSGKDDPEWHEWRSVPHLLQLGRSHTAENSTAVARPASGTGLPARRKPHIFFKTTERSGIAVRNEWE